MKVEFRKSFIKDIKSVSDKSLLMKIMKKNLLKSVSLLAGIFFLISAQETLAQSNNAINRFISKQAKSNKAHEYKEARKIIYADLNNDRKKEAIILYTLESFDGNNDFKQYLAIFTKTRSGASRIVDHKIIGGKGNRKVDLQSVKNGNIHISTLNYLPTDGLCCPSGKGISRIILSKNKLKEFKIK